MTWTAWIPVLVLLTSLVPAVVILLLPERRERLRTALSLAGAAAKVALVVALVGPVVDGRRPEVRVPFLPDVDLVLRVEPFSLYFLGLSAFLWLVTTVYAVGYLRDHGHHRSRFFGFFSLCVVATSGVALSGNLVTFVVFYELLTLATYPLVAHDQTPAALRGARTYLHYTLVGGVALLLGAVWLTVLIGPVEFADRGSPAVAALAASDPGTLRLVVALMLGGLAVKAALVPVHGWLPKAMVAPAPVSALLHAVAVVKAGVFGIVLVVDMVLGVQVAEDLGVLLPLTVVACVTILWGSVRALAQDGLKARLAYSTVSQVSYVVLGVSLVSATGMTGGVVHIVHQGLMKITLFFCAGLLAQTLGLTRVSQLAGVGRRMPLTCAAFTVGALGMIGIPPVAGFVTKWWLGLGALDAGEPWVLAVLVTSSLLNAAYFLPVVARMWWGKAEAGAVLPRPVGPEAPWTMVTPALVTAGCSIAVALGAGLAFSPLSMARVIVEEGWWP
ncbi:proton-conducting transporter transmembrane domain-containing protein [Cellulomonas triticagri]|uniref:Monovalent cation/H+ antiporter subunit D family protein n=1 Tax=Cellulomonas triticagri TaxID=2483352 RepID=A0A3M2IW78_9CELL|nr:proton-conducting transporter membrane subunit [Cellulomonas triticagri]RMI03563.1 monovalent cation/H+ antiporter subunit D family protein [Cellulomonas triticagri]